MPPKIDEEGRIRLGTLARNATAFLVAYWKRCIVAGLLVAAAGRVLSQVDPLAGNASGLVIWATLLVSGAIALFVGVKAVVAGLSLAWAWRLLSQVNPQAENASELVIAATALVSLAIVLFVDVKATVQRTVTQAKTLFDRATGRVIHSWTHTQTAILVAGVIFVGLYAFSNYWTEDAGVRLRRECGAIATQVEARYFELRGRKYSGDDLVLSCLMLRGIEGRRP
jgi:hypothetical protein